MDFDIVEIKDYYDTEIINYDFTNLKDWGISEENAHFLIDIGVPEQYDDFSFYESGAFQVKVIEGEEYIQIGQFASYGMRDSYGLYLKQGSDMFFTTSSLDKSNVYMLNKNLGTFFLFHLIRSELATKMRLEGTYTPDEYARALRVYFEKIDPIAMKNDEGYWSHMLEDYETGL
ncbi:MULTISPECIES: SUKH-4 family immunity protein [Paenibacillus]|uniref:SUKH-4 immunity protein of toxin-antitoxin system n=1 Tax=Paenibacillus pabuli TaxID=1472 RepID=A0A855Y5M8_9BACL|nr:MULTISPECIES: SUKH-4 family immunity protein [Paenibacillus]PWW37931.1 SUKH-4 immunity protein of toxin-antitoxin system [Paenibacillus pabuli]PXW08158.1 SUKH-4 immunity protein of toxin-antitoxin system [Paenibacillus taichungensis]